ncbi:MAG TPA: universal stress protein [Candidatus Obscuribacter sp.]|nr:universal stress protein [Candidatus Obscuribacter sp.]HMX45015.1 universal stress protein [Candidatus Obscuribacter sp.]HNA73615.1 universal stress protein [Candidatus Obscuribacter sp.]HNB17462.1 universal stress protein [Candidatus Obscuribacter sp.]HND04396.1 universal stress protein [Candidatus Obscuribacter sp.]
MKVLIAVDDSKFSQKIGDFVVRQAFPAGTEFVVLSVVENMLVGSYMSVLPSPMLEEIKAAARTTCHDTLEKLAARIAEHYPAAAVKQELLEGFPKEEIIEYAASWGADLIIVGTHGRKGLSRFVMGSVSQAVCQSAPCSVLLVR